MTTRTLKSTIIFGALSVLITSCGSDNGSADSDPETADTETVTAEPQDQSSPDAESAEETHGSEDDAEETANAEAPGERIPPGGVAQVPEEELPGEDSPQFFEPGDEVGVAGLDPAQAPMPVSDLPGAGQDAEIVGGLEPTDAVVTTGRARVGGDDFDSGIWTEIELADGYGWVEGGLHYFAAQRDITEDFIGVVPAAEDPQMIAEGVAERYAEPISQGDPQFGHIALISTPEDFEEDFYRLDVTGVPDDAGDGARLFVTVEDTGNGYRLSRVMETPLCSRGVSEEGICA